MKKRSIWVLLGLLVAALTFALVGCGGDDNKDNEKTEYKLSATQIELTVGQTRSLTISPAPEAEVTWASADPAVATVEGGTVTAVKEGSTTVTAQIEGVETPLSCSVTVKAEQQGGGGSTKEYALNFTALALKTGETKQLSVSDEGGNAVTSGVSYKSENADVATVSATGLVTAVAAGSADIKATVDGKELTCSVTVTQAYQFSLEPASLDIAAGATAQLTLKSTPELPEGGRPHTFTSSNTAVATVDGGSGLVTGVAKGTAVITCSVEGVEVTANVTVTEYTVKIGGEEMGAELALRVGEADKQITVTADPAEHAVDATFKTSDAGVVTVEGGMLHAVAAGTATVTVTVGGREFQTTVTVTSQVQYTLKAGGEDIEGDTVTMMLGDTLQLSVERDPAGELPAISYNSQDANVAQAGDDGLITAKGVGTTTVTVAIAGADTFEITVNVLYDVDLSEVEYLTETSVNLDALDETNETIDWRYYGRDNYTDRKNGGNLIGDLVGEKAADFYDYRVSVGWTDGTTTAQQTGGRKDGLTYKQSVSFTVKFTAEAKYISVFTGAYHATNTIAISYNGVVCASKTFENKGNDDTPNKCKQIIFTPDAESLPEGGMEFTITITVGAESSNGWADNISLVAIAVVGKEERVVNTPSATAEAPVATALTNETRNLSLIGTEDWVYAKNGDKGELVRRSGVENVIKDGEIQYTGGGGTDWLQPAFGKFSWYEQDSSAAPDGGSVNNTRWVDNAWSVPIHLTEGKHVVTLYLTGWKASYFVTVVDGNANTIVETAKVVTGYGTAEGVDNGGNQAVEVKIIIDVTAEDTFTFRMTKEGDGNHGWAAIAVGYATDLTLEKTEFDVTLGGTAPGKVVVKKGGEVYTTDVSFASGDTQVVTVDQADGTLTAVGKGRAIVTATIGQVKLRAFVTVTEYTLTSGDNIILSVEKTAEIKIKAEPERAINATYAVTAGGEFVEVSDQGVITANAKGNATVTATVGGKVFTINVKVVEYKLDQDAIVLTLGGETDATATLHMTEGEGGSNVTGVVFSTEDNKIADIDASTGLITAKGFGKTVVKAEKDGTVLECAVTVKLKVGTNETKDYADDNNTVNLDELDETNVTLDWRYFGRDGFSDQKKDGSLIDEKEIKGDGDFFDYRAKINWLDGTQFAQSFLNRRDGIVFRGNATSSVSFTVKVTQDVKYISVFTGAYHAKYTVDISYDGVQYAAIEFSNNGSNDAYQGNDNLDKNKQIIFTPDMEHFGTEEKTFTITLTCGQNLNGWSDNVSLVAIAVVGNTPRGAKADSAAATATVTHADLMPSEDNTIDLSEVGTLDWAYINNGGNNGMVHKNGGTAIGEIYSDGGMGGGNDGFGTKHQFFSWTDGTQEIKGADGNSAKTNLIKSCDNIQSIAVKLSANAKVTLYISAWQPSCYLNVYDANGYQIVANELVMQSNGGDNAVKAEITLTVTAESTFTFVINKDGGGNFCIAAIAVANLVAE